MAPDVWLEHQIGDGTNTVQRYRVVVQRVWEDRAGERGPEGWLVLMGQVGCGKTHLAAAIANYRVEKGQQVFFVVVAAISSMMTS